MTDDTHVTPAALAAAISLIHGQVTDPARCHAIERQFPRREWLAAVRQALTLPPPPKESSGQLPLFADYLLS